MIPSLSVLEEDEKLDWGDDGSNSDCHIAPHIARSEGDLDDMDIDYGSDSVAYDHCKPTGQVSCIHHSLSSTDSDKQHLLW